MEARLTSEWPDDALIRHRLAHERILERNMHQRNVLVATVVCLKEQLRDKGWSDGEIEQLWTRPVWYKGA